MRRSRKKERKFNLKTLRYQMSQMRKPPKKEVLKTGTLTIMNEPEVWVRLFASRDQGEIMTKDTSEPLVWRQMRVDGVLNTFDMWSAKSESGTFRITKNPHGFSMYLDGAALGRGFKELKAAQGYCELKRIKEANHG